MISIFVMYSDDRKKAFEYTVSCLRDMHLYNLCQKTLVADVSCSVSYPEWGIVQVPRLANKFCWGRMWDAGVFTAAFDKILYLDSDRLLPVNYLEKVNELLKDDMFLFTSQHFMMEMELSIEECKSILGNPDHIFQNVDLSFELRHIEPLYGPGKNVMSGSTAFTKSTFINLGGVDHWYCGHGAYVDSDFHRQAAMAGCSFVDLELPELHYPHRKLNNGKAVNDYRFRRLALKSFIYYCQKWDIPMSVAIHLAEKSGIYNPEGYVKRQADRFLVKT